MAERQRCAVCGKEAPAEATRCPDDGAWLGGAKAPAPPAAEPTVVVRSSMNAEAVAAGKRPSAMSYVALSHEVTKVPDRPSRPGLAPAPQTQLPPEDEHGSDDTVIRDPLIGTMLDQYQVVSRLGDGGMGVVYRAVQPMIGKEVAVKVLRPHVAQDPVAVKRLLEEARAVNAIRHRGIIDIFGFGQLDSGQQYVVMELLHGQPLDELIRAQGRLAPAEAAHILDEILSALGAAHAAGVIHRDLKPNNIFLATVPGAARFVKILDFGLVKRTGEGADTSHNTQTNMAVGTPEYIAPEQARAEKVTPAADLYAVGVIAFELLTGRLPFQEATLYDFLRAHISTPPPLLSSLVPGCPSGLEKWVAQLLEKEPARRPASAEQARTSLAEALRTAAAAPPGIGTAQSTAASRAGPARAPHAGGAAPTAIMEKARPEPAPSRTPRWAFLAGAIVLVLLVVGAATLFGARQRVEPKPAPLEPPPALDSGPGPVAALVPLIPLIPEAVDAGDDRPAAAPPSKVEVRRPAVDAGRQALNLQARLHRIKAAWKASRTSRSPEDMRIFDLTLDYTAKQVARGRAQDRAEASKALDEFVKSALKGVEPK